MQQRSRSRRRERGAAALTAAVVALALCAPGCGMESLTQERTIMGGPARITIQVRDPQRGEAALAAAFEELAVLGQLLSNHRPDSEISRLNANAGRKGVQLDPRTFEVLRLAKEYHTLTEGAFDITVGSVMAAWKMYDNPDVPLLDDHRKAAKRIGVTQLRLSERLGSAHLPLSGVRIDLGGIGRGYAADRAVQVLQERGVPRGRVDLAGDMRFFSDNPREEWTVEVPHPRKAGAVLTRLTVGGGAVSTAMDRDHSFTAPLDGRTYSTVLHPTTGMPVKGIPEAGVISVTVLAETAAAADALATALYVLGPERGIPLVNTLAYVDAIVVTIDAEGRLEGFRSNTLLDQELDLTMSDPASS